MKIRATGGGLTEKIPIDMTPMIDIVFQLMAFFIMTLKIVVLEGDFNVKMPLAVASSAPPSEPLLPPIKVRLVAGSNGQLSSIMFGERNLGTNFKLLRQEVMNYVGTTGPESAAEDVEVEIDAAYDLRYEHVIDCVTHVTGYIQDGQPVTLVEKIKFTPPTPPN